MNGWGGQVNLNGVFSQPRFHTSCPLHTLQHDITGLQYLHQCLSTYIVYVYALGNNNYTQSRYIRSSVVKRTHTLLAGELLVTLEGE